MRNKEKQILGWREYIDLPDWEIKKLKAKIDTGAKSCSLHVEDIKELPGKKISFYVVLNKNNHRRKVIAKPEKKGNVKSSIGTRTSRWYVQTKIKIGDIERMVRINLINREEMNFRMLIGRTAIEDDFLIDVAHGYLLNKNPPRKIPVKKKLKLKLKRDGS